MCKTEASNASEQPMETTHTTFFNMVTREGKYQKTVQSLKRAFWNWKNKTQNNCEGVRKICSQ